MSSISARLTRRQAMAVASSGLITWPAGVISAEAIPFFDFLIVSDTHLGRKDNKAAERQWQKTAPELDQASGDFVLHLGDVVDGGREKQYPIYKEVRKGIRKPVYEIPGNHDPLNGFARHLRKAIDFAFDHKGIRFILCNNSRRTSHNGFLKEEQLKWIAEQLQGAAKKNLFAILCMHVPAHGNRHPDRGWYIKPEDGQTRLYALLKKHKDRALALFHGHFHNGIRGWDDHHGIQEILCPSALYNLDRGLTAKKAPGYNLNEFRPGFVQVQISPKGMRLRYKPVGAKPKAEKQCQIQAFSQS